MQYSVISIEEDMDYGCEEREEDYQLMALVTLMDADGRTIVLKQPEEALLEREIGIGDLVKLDRDSKLIELVDSGEEPGVRGTED